MAVLPIKAEPADENGEKPAFQMQSLTCRAAVALRTVDAIQHVLFTNGARRLQLSVTGADLLSPVRLLTDAIVAPQLSERRYLLMRQLGAVASTGDLSARLHAADPRSVRLGFVLHVLDGWLARTSQHDIAKAILGRQRVNADWTDPRDHLRDRIRRAVRRGRCLMQRGYLTLLK